MSERNGVNESGGTETPRADIGEEAGERARATLDHAREDARALVERARASARSAIDRQKAEAASQLDGVSRALRTAADSLEQQQQGAIGRYAGFAAESLSDMAQALNDQDLPTLLRGARKLARRQPALFVGGAVALGFGLARFLKTSGEGADLDDSESDADGDDTAARDAAGDKVEYTAPPRSSRSGSAAAKPRGRPRGRGAGTRGRNTPLGAS